MTRLDASVSSVSAARAAVLGAVDAIESAASRLDATDALCAAGKGSAARASFRAGLPVTRSARQGISRFAGLVTAYSRALDGLRDASGTGLLQTGERDALRAVVRDGRSEAAALEGFRRAVAAAWPAYDRLSADEDVWSSHAVSGWYRSSKESADAYAVLVSPRRPALNDARNRLAAAAAALDAPTAAQGATLRQADAALDRLRRG